MSNFILKVEEIEIQRVCFLFRIIQLNNNRAGLNPVRLTPNALHNLLIFIKFLLSWKLKDSRLNLLYAPTLLEQERTLDLIFFTPHHPQKTGDWNLRSRRKCFSPKLKTGLNSSFTPHLEINSTQLFVLFFPGWRSLWMG